MKTFESRILSYLSKQNLLDNNSLNLL